MNVISATFKNTGLEKLTCLGDQMAMHTNIGICIKAFKTMNKVVKKRFTGNNNTDLEEPI